MRYIPNVGAKTFTTSAFIIGLLLIDDTTSNEQNALGNWLMLVAQVLCTNAYYQQVRNERSENSTNNYGYANNNNFNTDNMSKSESIRMLKKMVDAINKEISNIEKDCNF